MISKAAADAHGEVASPPEWRPDRCSSEDLGHCEVPGVGAADQLLDSDDARDLHAVPRSDRVHDQVDGVSHERAECSERQVASDVGQLAEEPKPAESLCRRARVDRRVPGDARGEREEEGERLTVSDLADNGDIGSHAKEAGDESPEVDLGTVGARRTGLHLRDVGQRDVSLEDLFGDHDAQ